MHFAFKRNLAGEVAIDERGVTESENDANRPPDQADSQTVRARQHSNDVQTRGEKRAQSTEVRRSSRLR